MINLLKKDELNYIRCLRPNSVLAPNLFERRHVMEQMERLAIPPLVQLLSTCLAVNLPLTALRDKLGESPILSTRTVTRGKPECNIKEGREERFV